LDKACWVLPAYGRWNVTKVWHGTGEALPVLGGSREKVFTISACVKGGEVGRESEGVIAPED